MIIEIIKEVTIKSSTLNDPGDGDDFISFTKGELTLRVGHQTIATTYADAIGDVFLVTTEGVRLKLLPEEYKIIQQEEVNHV